MNQLHKKLILFGNNLLDSLMRIKGDSMKTVAVIGAGYVGLVTGACFAQKGIRVVIVENNQAKIDMLLQGNIPFYEPHLDAIVSEAIAKGTLFFKNNIPQGLAENPDIIFSCVGTPSLENGAADLSFVEHVAHEIGTHMQKYALVVNKSTVPVGSAQKVRTIISKVLAQRGVSLDFDVASNPEFLKEGDAVNDFLHPDRIVVGVSSQKAGMLLQELYKPFISNDNQFLTMNIESAELTKYASNAMLATRISFMNQLAHLADIMGADIEHVKRGMAKDRRIGPHFLNAGIGYGGSCFPKDVKALVHMGKENNFPMTLAQEVENINHFQRVNFINKISVHYGPALSNKTVGILGLSFKPETDDIRCAPSHEVIDDLLAKGTKIIACDPIAQENIKACYGDKISFAQRAQDVLAQADFLIILTEWKDFLLLSPQDFLQLKDKTVFDGRNCFDPGTLRSLGITYFCVGRNSTATLAENMGTTTCTAQISQATSDCF